MNTHKPDSRGNTRHMTAPLSHLHLLLSQVQPFCNKLPTGYCPPDSESA